MIKLVKKLLNKGRDDEQIDYEFYKTVDIFNNLSKNEIQKLSELFLMRHFKRGELIFRENYPHVVLYIIKSGEVKLYLSVGKEKITITDLFSKSHFGEIGIFLETNRIVSAVASVDTDLIAIKHSDLKKFIKLNPAAGLKLLYNSGRSLSSDLIERNLKVIQYETKKQNS